ncbi:DsbC family protein [Rugamonas aquatica]|nr:DsbC family protein [Rugamonas aquatica]
MQNNKARLTALIVGALLSGANAWARPEAQPEQQLLARLRRLYPGTVFDAVARTAIPDWYQVTMGANTAYVHPRHLRYLVFGTLFDADALAGRHSHADGRAGADIPVLLPRLEQLPLADAVLTRGDGSGRRMVVFSDPACPYCRQLEHILDDVKDVSVYTFMVPFLGRELSHAIWCSADRAAAWRRALAGENVAEPAGSDGCSDPLERNLALARRLRVQGTPTLLFGAGVRLDGVAGGAELEAALQRAAQEESDHETKR